MLWLEDATVVCRAVLPQVNLAVQLYPGVVAAPIILGTISGCGGRLLADGIMTGWQVRPPLQPKYDKRLVGLCLVA
jgi:hypothetical protein